MTAAGGEGAGSDFIEIEAPDGSIVEFPKDTAPDVMARAMRRTYGLSETGRRARSDRERGILAEREAQARRSPLPAFDEMGQPTVPDPPVQAVAMPEPAPFVPQDERTTAGAMGRQFARGAIETAGLVPKGAAGLGARLDYNEQDIANLTDRYAAADPATRAQMRRDALAQFRDSPGTRDGLMSRFSDIDEGVAVPRPQPVTPIEQRRTYQVGEAIDEFGRTRFPTTREEDAAFLTGQVPRAVGSTAAMAPVALAGAPFGALGRLLAGVGLATTGSGEAAQNAVDRRRTLEDMVRAGDAPSPDAYPSDRQIATAAGQGLAPGALDAAAIDNLLRPVVRAPGFRGLIAAVAMKAVEQGIVEGTTEGVQQVAQNLIQRFGYNPDQAVLDQVAENVLVGGVVGVLTGGLAGGAIRPTRGQVDQPPQALPVQETRPDVSRETVGPAVPQSGSAVPEGAEQTENAATGETGKPLRTPSPAPSPPTPSPEDLQSVLEDPRPVAEIMAERERQATVAAVAAEDGPEAASAVAKVLDGQGRRNAPVQVETAQDIAAAVTALSVQPTPGQAEAGNYQHIHVRLPGGLDIAIEVPRGGERVGVGPDGRPWSVTMPAHYGYLKAGKDSGDGKVDVFVGDEIDAPRVYVIDQIDPRTGKFDEPKVMLGMDSEATASAIYEASYSDGSGPARMGAITRMTVAELRAWLRDGNPRKPLAYKPAPVATEPAGVALEDVADAPTVAAPQDQAPPPPASPTAAPAAFPLQGGQASAAAPPVPAPVQGPAVAPADPLATVRNLASRIGVNLTGAEIVNIRELLADGVHPEIALEIALERSGLQGAGEIAEATQEGVPDGQEQAAPDAGAADGVGEVAGAQGARAEPADSAAAPEGAQRSEPAVGGEQGQGDARGVEPRASVPAEPAAEPERKPTARERREEKLRQKRDAEIKRREAAKKAIATRRAKAEALDIVQTLARAGGIKDPGGDLQAIMGRPNHMVPVFGALRSERGMEPDRAREMLVEAGFLPEGATLNDLYAAIDQTIRGKPVYSERDTNAALDKARERRERRAGDEPRYQRPRTERITVAKDSLSDEQMVIPGAERVAAEGKKAAKAPQRSVAETPLFGGEQAATREVKDEDRKREAGRQGALFQKSQIDTPEFRRWFGDSKVVDKNGQPLVVYHGTAGTFSEFSQSFAGSTSFSASGLDGFFFSADPETAGRYAKLAQKNQHERYGRFYSNANIMPLFLSLQNPLVYKRQRGDASTLVDDLKRKTLKSAKAAGHDGVIFRGFRDTPTGIGRTADVFVAFRPEQIKSAISNSGAFDPITPDIRAQASDRFRVADQIDAVNSLSPQDRRRRDAVMQAVTTTVRRMAGAATPQTVTADIMEVDGQELWGAYSPADHLLAVSTRSPDPIGTVRHETIHVLRQLGLIDDAAWSALEDAAERGDWLTKHEITDRWGDQLTRGQALEEAIAEEFGVGLREGVWKTGNARVDAIFQRIAEFFRRVRAEIKRALSAAGMRDLSDADVAEMVFSLIERGAFREGRGATAGQRSVMAQPAAESGLAFQIPEIGARAAAARPMARRLRDLRSAIADLRGGNNDPLAKVRVPNDIGWARKTMVTPRTIAAYFPSFADVFFAGVRQFRARDKSISELTEIARPYLDLDQASKERVNKVVEHGRMAGEVYAPDADGTIKVTNKVGQQIKGKIGGVTLMKGGETITLTPDEARAYRAYRKVMDVALDKFRDQVLREYGFDPADPSSPKTADGVDDLVEAEENAGERARLKSLAQVLSSIQQAKKRGYVPFTRYGSHYVTVTTLQDGKRAVVHREHIEPGLTTTPRAPWVLKKVTIPRLEQEGAALRKRLAEIYPPDQGFEISELREVSPDNIGDLPDFSDLDAIIQAANLPPEQAAKVQQAIGEVIQKRGFRAHFIKSRNIPGYCIAPDTKILTDAMEWVEAGSIKVGDKLVGFEEWAQTPKRRRRMDVATVERVERLTKPCYRLTMRSGRTIVASDNHLFLNMRGGVLGHTRWKSVEDIVVGDRLKTFPQENPKSDFESGWFSGILDGEGWMCRHNGKRNGGLRMGWAQNPGAVLDRSIDVARRAGFTVYRGAPTKSCKAINVSFCPWDAVAALQAYRPSRLISEHKWVGAPLPTAKEADAVISKEYVGEVEVVGIKTTSHTFIANGFASHNSSDFERSLADYIVGISGYLARREHLPEIEQGIASIPATQPELRRYAKEWNAYIQNPSEEFQPLRQAGFLWYLSGRFSSAVVNLSQIPMVTQPYLSMFAGHAATATEIARAYKDAALAVRPKTKAAGGAGLDVFSPDALPEDVRDVVKAALADGTLMPIETFQEMARAKGRTPKSRSIGAKAQAAQDAAAFMFQAAERTNRLVSFIAAYRLAQRPEVMGRIRADLRDNPLWTRRRKDRQLGATEFAAFVVEETQFVLGKVNRTRMMRGPGAVIFQFKAFAANYIELMARLGAFGSGVHRGGRRYAALASMMFAMFLVGGLFGLPGAEDGLEMIEALIKTATGVDPQFEDGLRESAGSLAAWAARQLGADEETQAGVSAFAGRAAARGVARETGVDVSQRIGMGRIAPKPTGTEQDDFWYRAIGLAGIPGSWVLRGVDTGYAVARGDWLQAGIRLAPEAIADQMRAYQLADEGVKTIAKGRKVIMPDETLPDGTVAGGASNVTKRVLGFQPTGISRAREQMNAIRRAGEAPRDLFADFNLRRANIQAAINRASDTLENATSDKERASAKAAVGRETKRLERVMGEIETYNKSAPAERSYKIDNPGYRQQLKIANQGQRATQIKKVPMRVRGGIEDIRARY